MPPSPNQGNAWMQVRHLGGRRDIRLDTVAAPANAFQLLRALKLGALLSLVGSALFLAGSALLHRRVSCEGLSPNECELTTAAHATVARQQGLAAVGCTLVAAGLGLFLKAPRPTKE